MPKAKQQPFMHPLWGSNLTNLLTLLYQNGPVSPKYWPKVITALSAALVRMPFSAVEKMTTEGTMRKMKEMPAPIFIVGHWQSGAASLSNLLSQSPQFGYASPVAVNLPWNMLMMGKMVQPFLNNRSSSYNFTDIDPALVKAPQEDELGMANMLPVSYLHALYFPKNFIKTAEQGLFFDDCKPALIEKWKKMMVYYLKKISIHQNHKQLLVRNAVYTSRIRMLKALWPEAKFIHIYRNPYHIFYAMKNYYQGALSALALQSYRHLDTEAFIFSTYTRMMQHLLEDTKRLSAHEFIHVRYEDLAQTPLPVIKKIYDQLHLEGYENALPHFEQYLSAVQSNQKNTYPSDPQEMKRIYYHWSPFIQHLGYK